MEKATGAEFGVIAKFAGAENQNSASQRFVPGRVEYTWKVSSTSAHRASLAISESYFK